MLSLPALPRISSTPPGDNITHFVIAVSNDPSMSTRFCTRTLFADQFRRVNITVKILGEHIFLYAWCSLLTNCTLDKPVILHKTIIESQSRLLQYFYLQSPKIVLKIFSKLSRYCRCSVTYLLYATCHFIVAVTCWLMARLMVTVY